MYIGLYALTNRLAVIWCKNSFANFQVNHGLNNCYRYDSVIGVVAEHDGTTERLVERHPLFGNNFGRQDSEVVHSKTLIQFFSGWTTRREKGVYDTIVYVLATVFHVSQATLQVILLCLLFLDKLHPCTVLNFLLLNQEEVFLYLYSKLGIKIGNTFKSNYKGERTAFILFHNCKLHCSKLNFLSQLLIGVGAILRNSFDWLVDYAIDSKLTQVLTCMRIVHLCKLLEGIVQLISKSLLKLIMCFLTPNG